MTSTGVTFGGPVTRFFPFLPKPELLRYDCELDEWNHCYEFDLSHAASAENTAGTMGDSAAGENATGVSAGASTSKAAVRLDDPHNLRAFSPTLASMWRDTGEFLHSRYGVNYISEVTDASKDSTWSAMLGICCTPPTSLVDLYNHVIAGRWPRGTCDLSPDLTHANLLPGASPGLSTRATLLSTSQGYLISISEEWNVSWKLIIWDPLTVLQIEREGWVDPCDLINGLVKKGVPFQILNPQKLEGAQLHNHPDPVVHPGGKQPQRSAYLAYRQELQQFFIRHPHAYSAALSAGGILWRITMDVLPPPNGADVIRPFHPDRCLSLTINGKEYWTPRLTLPEKNVVVGVCKQPACESTHGNSLSAVD